MILGVVTGRLFVFRLNGECLEKLKRFIRTLNTDGSFAHSVRFSTARYFAALYTHYNNQ